LFLNVAAKKERVALFLVGSANYSLRQRWRGNCSTFGRIEDAIAREKQVKNRNRSWKDKLISIPVGKILFVGLKIT
jgi:predicted GIY-YIG superfamily endonuclease